MEFDAPAGPGALGPHRGPAGGEAAAAIAYGAAMVEVDEYEGDLRGLLVAEVEFDDEAASDAFTPPDWFGPEVTEDDRYKNRALAVDGRPA